MKCKENIGTYFSFVFAFDLYERVACFSIYVSYFFSCSIYTLYIEGVLFLIIA